MGLLIWLVSMIAACVIASGNNRSTMAAFFWALFLGPVGTLIVAVQGKAPPAPPLPP